MWKRMKQALLWVAEKIGEAIIWVAEKIVAVVETAEKIVVAVVEAAIEVVERVRHSEVAQTIGEGFDTLKKIKEWKELPKEIYHFGSAIWAYATGKCCFSWAASSGLCTLCGIGYTAIILLSFTASLYLLGLLTTAFRS